MVSTPSPQSGRRLFLGARIFDGARFHERAALLVESGRVLGIVPVDAAPHDVDLIALHGGILAPGLVDLQVNGGGGVQFNETPTIEGIAAICAAHGRGGTTSVVVTLISSDEPTRARAIAAAAEAWRIRVPGFAGLHLEGPHIVVPGAHAARHLRPLTDADIAVYLAAREALPALIITLAPESAARAQIGRLASAGIVVSLGHTACTYDLAMAAAEAGASMTTHLFNAMGPLAARAPGLVGAALDSPRITPSLIADGQHVAAAAARIALSARAQVGDVVLVSDAMAPSGSNSATTTLDGRLLRRDGSALRDSDGRLAGSASTLLDGVRWLVESAGASLKCALAAAGAAPARCLGISAGGLTPDATADLLHLGEDLSLCAVWRAGLRL